QQRLAAQQARLGVARVGVEQLLGALERGVVLAERVELEVAELDRRRRLAARGLLRRLLEVAAGLVEGEADVVARALLLLHALGPVLVGAAGREEHVVVAALGERRDRLDRLVGLAGLDLRLAHQQPRLAGLLGRRALGARVADERLEQLDGLVRVPGAERLARGGQRVAGVLRARDEREARRRRQDPHDMHRSHFGASFCPAVSSRALRARASLRPGDSVSSSSTIVRAWSSSPRLPWSCARLSIASV